MSKRILLVALLPCAIVAVLLTRPASSGPRQQAQLQIDGLLAFEQIQINLPEAAGPNVQAMVTLDGQARVLDLEAYSLRSADFQLLVDTGGGNLVEVEPPPPATYRGSVAGVPGSRVAASIIAGQLRAAVWMGDEVFGIEPLERVTGQAAPVTAHVAYREADVVLEGFCGVVDDGLLAGPAEDADGGGVASGTGLQLTELATDADIEYWLDNGQSVPAAMLAMETVIGLIEPIYETQLDITFDISTMIVRTGTTLNDDPYSGTNSSNLLNQVATTWGSAPESGVTRDLVHMFTGRNLSAGVLGIAYTSTVCSGSAYGLVTNPSFVLTKRALSAHEIGHNFGAPHCCSEMCNGTCPDCKIMCACLDSCAGGIEEFGTGTINAINLYVVGIGCLLDLAPPITPPFYDKAEVFLTDTTLWITQQGLAPSEDATRNPSEPYAHNLDSQGPEPFLHNRMSSNFINLAGMDNDGVVVQYYTEHKGVENGEELVVEYWADDVWNELNRVTSDGSDQIKFDFHKHDLSTLGPGPSPFHSEFRIRFRTEGDEADDDWYLDDIFVGADPPQENVACYYRTNIFDGVTPFTTFGATTDGLALVCEDEDGILNDIWYRYEATCEDVVTISTCNDADFDTILALYFQTPCPVNQFVGCSDDATGCSSTSTLEAYVFQGTKYTLRVGSPDGTFGSGNITITCGAEQTCEWDCDGSDDGAVNVSDLLALLGQYDVDAPSNCTGGACDYDLSGCVDIADLLKLLGHYDPAGTGCP